MAPVTPTGIPLELVAGDSWRWRISAFTDYPQSEGWALNYRLLGVKAVTITVAWQTSGDDANYWLATTTTTVSQVPAGRYRLIGYMVGSDSYAGREESVSDDVVIVLPNPRTAVAGDLQPLSEYMVDALTASVRGMVSDDALIEQYGIAGRQVTKMPFAKRLAALSAFRWQQHADREGMLGRRVEFHLG